MFVDSQPSSHGPTVTLIDSSGLGRYSFVFAGLSSPSLSSRRSSSGDSCFQSSVVCWWQRLTVTHSLLLLLLSSSCSPPALLPAQWASGAGFTSSHPSLIKEFLHRYISPHRQCLFSRCCHVPFFALISSLKLFFLIPVPPASLPSPSFVRAVICDSLLPGGTCGKRS